MEHQSKQVKSKLDSVQKAPTSRFGGVSLVDNRPINTIFQNKTLTKKTTQLKSFGNTVVIQMMTTEEFTQAMDAARRVQDLTIQAVVLWKNNVTRYLSEIGPADPRRRTLENLYHIFARQELAREQNRPHLMTRIIAPEQLRRPNIGTNSVRRSSRSLKRNIGGRLSPMGSGRGGMASLVYFMRHYGGGGIQGLHGNPMMQFRVIRNVLTKMLTRRHSTSSRGPKFTMVAVDRRKLNQGRIHDLNSPRTRKMFLDTYYRFRKMYEDHRKEGVVAYEGTLEQDSIKGIRAFRSVPSEEDLKEILELLLDLSSAEPEPTFHKLEKRKDEDDENGGGSGSGGFTFGNGSSIEVEH